MIKAANSLLALLLLACSSSAQNSKLDSFDRLISRAKTDTQRIDLEIQKSNLVTSNNLDSAIALSLRIISESKKISYFNGELNARQKLTGNYSMKGNFKAAAEQLMILAQSVKASSDSVDYAKLYNNYGLYYGVQSKYDSSIPFYEKAIQILEHTKFTSMLTNSYNNIAIAYQMLSNYPMALEYYQKVSKISEAEKNEVDAAYNYVNMAILYNNLTKNKESEGFYLKAIGLAKKNELKDVELYAYSNLASLYYDMHQWDQVQEFSLKAARLGEQVGDKAIAASSLSRAAMGYAKKAQLDSALTLNAKAIPLADSTGQALNIYQVYSDRATILKMLGKLKEAIPLYEKSFAAMKDGDVYAPDFIFHYKELSECYERTGDPAKALSAFKRASLINDSVTNKNNIQKSTELSMNFQFEKKQELAKMEQDKKDTAAKRTKIKQYFIIAGLGLVVLAVMSIAFIQFRNNKEKQKANLLLEKQKQKVEMTLSELKSAQAQLIHSEKMASLGELTAGIAHEIQNPLNFVNNFSDVNNELISEMREEIAKRNFDDADLIAKDIQENEQKINHHGRRADAIVKGMLQHSRSRTGVQEPTDVNALADEYLRLSYHGLRAKDKSFNALTKSDFDDTIGKINIIPQDIGRVLLNLYANAFYAVNERSKNAGEKYHPTVSVETKKVNNNVEIRVSDNGSGIPPTIINKIFQPFFTTKPTGQGTGLGLSLSYDIIRAHNGELKVESREGEGSTFMIYLPI